MSRVYRALRAAPLQCIRRCVGDRGLSLDLSTIATTKYLASVPTFSDHPVLKVASESNIVYGESKGEALSDNFLNLESQRRDPGNASSQQIFTSGTKPFAENCSHLVRSSYCRAFSSEVSPEKEREAGETEYVSSVDLNLEETSPADIRVKLDPSERKKVPVAVLHRGEVEEELDSDTSDDEEIAVAVDDKNKLSLWKKIETVRWGSQKSVVPLIKEWVAEGNTLNKHTLVNTISRLRRRARFKQAMEISDYMSQDKNYQWEHMDEIVRIDLKFKLRQFRTAEMLFAKSPPEFKTEGAYNTLLKNYVEQNMVNKAEALMSKLKDSGLISCPFAFNQMLLLYKRRHTEDRIPALLEEMTATKIVRDAYTYNILMDVKARSGDLSGAEEVFEEMKIDKSIKPDAATYATLASAYAAANQPVKAQECLTEMENGEFERSRAAYDILIAQYGALGDLESVDRVWEKVKSENGVSNRSYVVVIEAFGKLRKIERAEEIFEELENKGMVLTRQYNALLSSYAHLGMTNKAEELLAKMAKAGRKRNAVTYHYIILGYVKSNRLDKALDAMKKVKADPIHGKIKLWQDTLVAVLDEFSKQGNIGCAEKHFLEIKKAYSKSTTKVYNTLLKSYANAKVPAGGFLQRMSADNVAPDSETFNLLRESGVPTERDDTRLSSLLTKTGASIQSEESERTIERQVSIM